MSTAMPSRLPILTGPTDFLPESAGGPSLSPKFLPCSAGSLVSCRYSLSSQTVSRLVKEALEAVDLHDDASTASNAAHRPSDNSSMKVPPHTHCAL